MRRLALISVHCESGGGYDADEKIEQTASADASADAAKSVEKIYHSTPSARPMSAPPEL
jgi:hypothetical protein